MSALCHRLGSLRPPSAPDLAQGEVFVWFSPSSDIQPPRYVRGRVLFFPSSGRVEGRRKAVRSKALVSDQTVQDQRNCSSSVVPCTSSYIVLFFLQYVLPGFCSMLRKLKSTLKRKKKFQLSS